MTEVATKRRRPRLLVGVLAVGIVVALAAVALTTWHRCGGERSDDDCAVEVTNGLEEALDNGSAATVEALMDSGFRITETDVDELMIDHAARSERDPLGKIAVLFNHGVRQSTGMALGNAASADRGAIVQALLEPRVSASLSHEALAAALDSAVRHNSLGAVKLLLDHGVDPTQNAKFGLRPIAEIMPHSTAPIKAILRGVLESKVARQRPRSRVGGAPKAGE